ncbi:MAG: hypothetical protein ACXWFS_07375 [Thermoanaerobaculia bacterium]
MKSLVQRLRAAAARYDHLIPWAIFALVLGATGAVLQLLIVKLIR